MLSGSRQWGASSPCYGRSRWSRRSTSRIAPGRSPSPFMNSRRCIDVFGRAEVPTATVDAEAEDLAVALEAVCFALNRPLTLTEAGEILARSPHAIGAAADALARQLPG